MGVLLLDKVGIYLLGFASLARVFLSLARIFRPQLHLNHLSEVNPCLPLDPSLARVFRPQMHLDYPSETHPCLPFEPLWRGFFAHNRI